MVGGTLKQTDVTQDPNQPQFPLGASSDEAYDHAQIANAPLGGPGDIVARLQSQQWTLPANHERQDAETSYDPNAGFSTNPGT